MKQVFSFAPASSAGANLLVLVIVAPVLAIAWYLLSAPRLVRFDVSPEGLRIRGDLFYGRAIPAAELLSGAARRVDLTAESDLKPVLRTNGTGLPGYKAGWYKLHNGQKALLFIGDPRKTVLIPVQSGYSLLLSVADPDQFLDALRAQFSRRGSLQ